MPENLDLPRLRALRAELSSANERLIDLTSSDPRVWTDPVSSAQMQLNSAIRYLDIAILKKTAP
jgi:hypothetical protein